MLLETGSVHKGETGVATLEDYLATGKKVDSCLSPTQAEIFEALASLGSDTHCANGTGSTYVDHTCGKLDMSYWHYELKASDEEFLRYDANDDNVLDDEELTTRDQSGFTDAKKRSPAFVLAINVLTADAGMNFLQAGVGLGVSIVFPLCMSSCDGSAFCNPYFTFYGEGGLKVGWSATDRVDKNGKKKTFAFTAELGGAFVGKVSFGIAFFAEQKDGPGRAGNINVEFPTIVKDKVKGLIKKVGGNGKAGARMSKIVPDGLTMVFTDPISAMKCDNAGFRSIGYVLNFGFQIGSQEDRLSGSTGAKALLEKPDAASEVSPLAQRADEDDRESQSQASSRKLTAISADSWQEDTSENLVEQESYQQYLKAGTGTGGGALPGKLDRNNRPIKNPSPTTSLLSSSVQAVSVMRRKRRKRGRARRRGRGRGLQTVNRASWTSGLMGHLWASV